MTVLLDTLEALFLRRQEKPVPQWFRMIAPTSPTYPQDRYSLKRFVGSAIKFPLGDLVFTLLVHTLMPILMYVWMQHYNPLRFESQPFRLEVRQDLWNHYCEYLRALPWMVSVAVSFSALLNAMCMYLWNRRAARLNPERVSLSDTGDKNEDSWPPAPTSSCESDPVI